MHEGRVPSQEFYDTCSQPLQVIHGIMLEFSKVIALIYECTCSVVQLLNVHSMARNGTFLSHFCSLMNFLYICFLLTSSTCSGCFFIKIFFEFFLSQLLARSCGTQKKLIFFNVFLKFILHKLSSVTFFHFWGHSVWLQFCLNS